jgi:hypothetical protein
MIEVLIEQRFKIIEIIRVCRCVAMHAIIKIPMLASREAVRCLANIDMDEKYRIKGWA